MADHLARYLSLCSHLNDCTTKADVRRHNAAMKKLSRLYHQIEGEQDRSFLLTLLKNDDGRTRALAAAHCLGLGVYLPEAKKVLSALAEAKADPVLAFEAKMTLDVWRQQGYLRF